MSLLAYTGVGTIALTVAALAALGAEALSPGRPGATDPASRPRAQAPEDRTRETALTPVVIDGAWRIVTNTTARVDRT